MAVKAAAAGATANAATAVPKAASLQTPKGQSAATVAAARTAAASAAVGSVSRIASAATAGEPQAKFQTAGPKAFASPSASSSSPVAERPEVESATPAAPRIAVDPMMAGESSTRSGVSFSEMTELPPLKEIYVAPPPPPAAAQPPLAASDFPRNAKTDKRPMQPRESAQKAIQEIKGVPASLMIYSIGGAAVLILLIAIGLVIYVNRLNTDAEGTRPSAALNSPYAAQPSAAAPEEAEPITPEEPHAVEEAAPAGATGKGRRNKARAAAVAAPAALPGMAAIDSMPQGAQIQIDGKSDPAWVTPFTISGLAAGAHTVTVSKAGYNSDTRSFDVTSGAKAFVVTHLAQLTATLSVSSTPAGANVYVDGRDTGKLTPAQVAVDKGQHVVLVRKGGYIDESISAQFALSQTTTFSPTLRALGNVDDIRPVNKIKKLFGGRETSGMGSVFVKTQPKGAQVAVNQHMMERTSPVDFMLDPGNYIVDITLTGYAPIHKVITVGKGGKVAIDEVMQHE